MLAARVRDGRRDIGAPRKLKLLKCLNTNSLNPQPYNPNVVRLAGPGQSPAAE